MIDPHTITAFDFETWGREDHYALQPFRMRTGDAWLTSAAIAYFKDGRLCAKSNRMPTAAQLAEWLATQAGRYVVCWNTPFDIAWLLVLDELHPDLGIRDKVFAINWLDGMLLYRHAINAPRYKEEGRMSLSLKEAVKEFFPSEAGYQEGVAFDPQSEVQWAQLRYYNKDDAKFTLRITVLLLQTLPEKVIRNAFIEARCLPLVADTKINGLRVNPLKAAKLGDQLGIARNAALTTLALQNGMLEWEKIIASPKQLRELLYEQWLLPVPHLTETGQPSTDKEALQILGLVDDRANLIYAYRENQTRKTKFCDGALQALDYNGDGYVRPDCRVFGTYTGRCTYASKQGKGKAQVPTGIAIHQWVNQEEYRELIVVDDDSELIEADFAGQEYRWMAVESQDPTMLGMCAPGEDAHAFMASRIQPAYEYEWIRANREEDPAANKARKLGKVGNLQLPVPHWLAHADQGGRRAARRAAQPRGRGHRHGHLPQDLPQGAEILVQANSLRQVLRLRQDHGRTACPAWPIQHVAVRGQVEAREHEHQLPHPGGRRGSEVPRPAGGEELSAQGRRALPDGATRWHVLPRAQGHRGARRPGPQEAAEQPALSPGVGARP